MLALRNITNDRFMHVCVRVFVWNSFALIKTIGVAVWFSLKPISVSDAMFFTREVSGVNMLVS